MNQFTLNLIIMIHLIFVLFIVLTPFVGNNYFLILHAVTVPFMMAHWHTNDNSCILTLMEKQARYKLYGTKPNSEECFTYNIIAPIYDFKKNNADFTKAIYTLTFALWFVTLYKLYDNYRNGKLNKLQHLVEF